MKKLSAIAIIPCIGVICLTAGVARGGTTGLGTNCVETWPYNVGLVYLGASVASASYSDGTTIACPIDSDHDVGGVAQFKVAVRDYSFDEDVSCYGVAYDSNGNHMGSSPVMSTSGSSGAFTNLTMSISGVDPASDWGFGVLCNIPEYPSGVSSVRVY